MMFKYSPQRKGFLCMIMFLLMLIPNTVGVIAEDNKETKINTYEFNVLKSLDLLSEEQCNLDADGEITRAQFASVVASLMGLDNFSVRSEKIFIDVPADYIYASQIYALRDLGIIGGTSEYKFEPDSSITYTQAIKIIISSLGYAVQAEGLYGGYPAGYVTVANSIRLINGLKFNMNDNVTVTDAMTMFYKATKVDILKEQSISNSIEYNTIDGRTLLSENHKIYFNKGLMTDNGITALSGASKVTKNNVIIDGVEYQKNNINVNEYIGFYVEYYYKEINGEFYICYIYPYESRNNVLEINQSELAVSDAKFSLTTIVYYKDGKQMKANINKLSDLIYNGVAYKEFELETLKINSGSIKLIDNNTDEIYDVIMINEYQNCFVLSTDLSDETIVDKYGNSIHLEKFDHKIIYNSEGYEVSLSAIKPNNIISYAKSIDNKNITLYVNAIKVEGTIEQITESTTISDAEYTIDGKVYKLAENLIKALANEKIGVEIPKIQNAYVFYLDKEGRIAAMDKSSTSRQKYAYLIDAVLNSNIDLSNSATVRLFMENGEVFDAYTSENITINGVVGKKGKDLIADSRMFDDKKIIIHQVVKIKLNALGDITEFDFADKPVNGYGYDSEKFTLDFEKSSSAYKGNNQKCFDGRYSINNNTLLFSVPSKDNFNADDIEIVKASALTDGKSYDITLYDADATLAAKVGVVNSGGAYEQAIFIVDKVMNSVNADGESVRSATGVSGGVYVTYTEKKGGVFPEKLKQGDVLRVGFAGSLVSRSEPLASLGENPEPFVKSVDGGLINGQFVVIYGYLYFRSDNAITTINPKNTLELIAPHSLNGGGAKVAIYDVKNKNVKVGNLADVVQNDVPNKNGELEIAEDSIRVFIYRRYDYVREVIVVK